MDQGGFALLGQVRRQLGGEPIEVVQQRVRRSDGLLGGLPLRVPALDLAGEVAVGTPVALRARPSIGTRWMAMSVSTSASAMRERSAGESA